LTIDAVVLAGVLPSFTDRYEVPRGQLCENMTLPNRAEVDNVSQFR